MSHITRDTSETIDTIESIAYWRFDFIETITKHSCVQGSTIKFRISDFWRNGALGGLKRNNSKQFA